MDDFKITLLNLNRVKQCTHCRKTTNIYEYATINANEFGGKVTSFHWWCLNCITNDINKLLE